MSQGGATHGRRVRLTGAEVSDYDLVVNGTNDLSTDVPEFRGERASHCGKVTVAVEVFTGLPIDEITITAKAK